MEKSITLNVPYDLPDSDWDKIGNIYKQMDGWQDNQNFPCWFGTEADEQYLCASSEPSGLQIFGKLDDQLWTGWLTKFCAMLSIALNREIYDAEM